MIRKLAAVFILAVTCAAGPAAAEPARWQAEWPETNFRNSSIDDWSEILSGGPPKDGIPALDDPDFRDVSAASEIPGREPVITVEFEGAAPRAYPLRYLTWHEIVNDTVGGIPVAVTFCPLCNSAMVFDRRTEHGTLSFGVSGKLRHSDMIMYDRQTESWWQQAVGTAIVGDLNGMALTQLPSWMESLAQFEARNPDGRVMAEPAHPRRYGANPYGGYDSADRPFLYRGEDPPHGIHPLARVVRVGARAWPLSRVRAEEGLREAGLQITWTAGQASALDTSAIAEGRDVGSVRVRDGAGRDVPHDVMFAFAYHALWPEGVWMLPD